MSDTPRKPAPAGRSIDEWSREVGICRATAYQLEDECQPHSVKVGKRRLITEEPRAWLERMATLGGARVKRKVAA